jgi:hypothetical protein
MIKFLCDIVYHSSQKEVVAKRPQLFPLLIHDWSVELKLKSLLKLTTNQEVEKFLQNVIFKIFLDFSK